MAMKVAIFVGDIANAAADALCTSTNPRLSLMMGTGASVRAAGGYGILRECESILANSGRGSLPAGSVHVTTAGALPGKCIIHCVASDTTHHSSPAIIDSCVRNALAAADAHGCRRVAMPVFGSGHARVKFDEAIAAMAAALADATTTVENVTIVIRDEDLLETAKRQFPGALIERSTAVADEPASLWSTE